MAKQVIVAIHGIGDQFRYETIQSVANQFCEYFGQPAAIPLGMFHSTLYRLGPDKSSDLGSLVKGIAQIQAKLRDDTPIPQPASTPETAEHFPAALVLKAPMIPQLPANLGFAEVYWADVPRDPAKDEHTLEESKKWAKTIVERLRLRYRGGGVINGLQLTNNNYLMAATVIQEIIQTVAVLERLLFLAEKAGLLRFDLNKVLVDYLGDVQIVAEYTFYRKKIMEIFDTVMTNISDDDPQAEIYLVAHSEGTVITFLGLLTALSAAERPAWVERVRGLMTIGSPINKHIILWPELFDLLKNPKTQHLTQPIEWRNYYDFGDPIGFRLDATRDWLKENHWTTGKQPFFNFNDKEDVEDDAHDIGFARYPLPGKAHNDYWNDAEVFGHFIQTVVKPVRPGLPRCKNGSFSRVF